MAPIRLLIADIDGTVVTRKKEVTPRAREAVEKMRAAGVLFAVTSGRPPRGVAKLSRELGLTTPIAAFNGGALVRPDLEVIEERRVPPEAAAAIIKYLKEAGVDAWVYSGVDWYVGWAGQPRIEKEKRNVGFEPILVDDFGPMLQSVVKIVAISDDSPLLASCEAEVRKRAGAHVTAVRSQPYYLDITHADANKGTVAHLNSRFHRVPLDQIAVIGDMLNDVLMFGVAGTSIAMGNSSPEVQRAARYITTSNEEEGFANAVDWFVLRTSSPPRRPAFGMPARVRACVMDLDSVLTKTAREGALRFVREVRKAGLRTAVISSSAASTDALRSAGFADLFDARIDGAKERLAPAPAPDLLLAAARAIGVAPAEAAVLDGTPFGVQAGRAGRFLYVVGVDRAGRAAELFAHGADAVVSDPAELLEPV